MFQFIWLCHDKVSRVEVPHQTFVQEKGVAKGYADVLRDSSADLVIVCLWELSVFKDLFCMFWLSTTRFDCPCLLQMNSPCIVLPHSKVLVKSFCGLLADSQVPLCVRFCSS
jgi:hypothetical protein